MIIALKITLDIVLIYTAVHIMIADMKRDFHKSSGGLTIFLGILLNAVFNIFLWGFPWSVVSLSWVILCVAFFIITALVSASRHRTALLFKFYEGKNVNKYRTAEYNIQEIIDKSTILYGLAWPYRLARSAASRFVILDRKERAMRTLRQFNDL